MFFRVINTGIIDIIIVVVYLELDFQMFFRFFMALCVSKLHLYDSLLLHFCIFGAEEWQPIFITNIFLNHYK